MKAANTSLKTTTFTVIYESLTVYDMSKGKMVIQYNPDDCYDEGLYKKDDYIWRKKSFLATKTIV